MPIVIYGQKKADKELGYAADFCPMCRNITIFKVTEYATVFHIYYIGLGGRNISATLAKCTACGFAMPADLNRYSPAVEIDPTGNIEKVIVQTYPNIAEHFGARAIAEKKLRENPGSLSQDERRALISQPIHAFSMWFDNAVKKAGIGASIVLGIILVTISFIVAMAMLGSEPEISVGAGVFGLPGIALIVYGALNIKKRFLMKTGMPVLRKLLGPVNPEVNEVEEAMGVLYKNKAKLAKLVTSNEIVGYMKANPFNKS